MRISQMSTDTATDALVRMSEYAGNIFEDKKVMDVIKGVGETGTKDASSGWALILSKLVPLCLKAHKQDFYGILAALDDKTVEDIGTMKFIETLNILKESVDRELLDFFDAFLRQIRSGDNS